MSSSGTKSWNYNTNGVAHYGMLRDFMMDVRTAPSNGYKAGALHSESSDPNSWTAT